jgi:16S rRNA (guanine966-N2)-methyltransferase
MGRLRPTSDKLRETLFNILAPRLEGARVCDGYAGTGAVGIEALSRGAAHVTFVEQDRRATALIAANVAAATRRRTILSRLAMSRRSCDGHAAAFDVIWLDPPYDSDSSDALDAAAGAPGARRPRRARARHAAATPACPASLTRIRDAEVR